MSKDKHLRAVRASWWFPGGGTQFLGGLATYFEFHKELRRESAAPEAIKENKCLSTTSQLDITSSKGNKTRNCRSNEVQGAV